MVFLKGKLLLNFANFALFFQFYGVKLKPTLISLLVVYRLIYFVLVLMDTILILLFCFLLHIDTKLSVLLMLYLTFISALSCSLINGSFHRTSNVASYFFFFYWFMWILNLSISSSFGGPLSQKSG